MDFKTLRNAAAVLVSALLVGFATTASALPLYIGGGAVSAPVRSFTELRWTRVIGQQYDYSCGAAAVATLLTYHYDMPTDEASVFDVMFAHGDQQRIRADGFSMLDLKRYLDSRGLKADGFRMSLDKLADIGVPGIILVNSGGYRHFVVVKGLKDDEVVVGDPAGGTVVVPQDYLEGIWNGVVLAARTRLEVAQQHFNDSGDWAVRPEAPLASGRRQSSLGVLSLSLPGLNEFGR